jgi:Cu(I)/Ag(I) efflux system membrane fusion protein
MLLSASIVIVAVAALVSGCNSPTPPAAPGNGEDVGHAGHSHTEQVDQAAAESHETASDPPAELSPEDLAAAEEQGVCPVSGQKLGSMGTPYKTTVKGQTVFLCCDGCEENLKKDPDKYLAKLNK